VPANRKMGVGTWPGLKPTTVEGHPDAVSGHKGPLCHIVTLRVAENA